MLPIINYRVVVTVPLFCIKTNATEDINEPISACQSILFADWYLACIALRARNIVNVSQNIVLSNVASSRSSCNLQMPNE